jgi:predicted amidophosphoribosyltransferase
MTNPMYSDEPEICSICESEMDGEYCPECEKEKDAHYQSWAEKDD